MRYLTLGEVLMLHDRVLTESGGAAGLRDLGALQSALAQPTATFDDRDLYETLVSKAASLAYSLVMNHPFVDGNKRIGHAAMEVFLVLNGFEVDAPVHEQETLFLTLADGRISRQQLTDWLESRLRIRDIP